MSLQFFREIDVVVALMMMSEGFGGGHYREKQHCLAFGLFCPYDCLNYHWTRKKEILEKIRREPARPRRQRWDDPLKLQKARRCRIKHSGQLDEGRHFHRKFSSSQEKFQDC